MIILRIPLLRRKLTLVIKLRSLGDLITQRRNKINKMNKMKPEDSSPKVGDILRLR